MPNFMSIKDTCKATGLAECFIRKLISEGKCPYIRSGNKFMINYPLFVAMLDTESKGGLH